jgi:hypothetical protein
MAPETPGQNYTQDNQAPQTLADPGGTITTSVEDAYRALQDEASTAPHYLRSRNPRATIGVLDVYSPPKEGSAAHGEIVHAILAGAGFQDQDLQRIDHSTSSRSNFSLASLIFQEGEEPPEARLDAYIELSAAHILTKTNGTFSQILADPGNLRTINQSQGSSRADVFGLLESASFWKDDEKVERLSAVGERLAQVCGFDVKAPDFTHLALRQAFVDRINAVVDGSQFIARQQQLHVDLLGRLRQRGILVVSSAGNSADELWNLRGRGLRVPDSFDDDLCKVGPKLVVGALDDHGTPGREDDEIAYFTSLYAGVNVMANGVNVPTPTGPATGTSFASPQVAAAAEKLRREHPEWNVEQIEKETKALFTATDGFNLLR